MRIWCDIDAAAAVRAGKTRSGILPIELSDEWLTSLTDRERQVLAKYPTLGDATRPERNAVHGLVEPTTDALLAKIRADVEREDKEQALKAAAAAAKREKTLQVLATRAASSGREYVYACVNASGEIVPGRNGSRTESESWYKLEPPTWDLDEDVMASPEWRAWGRDLQAQNEAASKLATERAMQKVRDSLAKEEQVLKQSRLFEEASAELVRLHGTQSQVERLEAGFLPESEIEVIVRDYLFAPFQEIPRYVRIRGSDIPCTCSYEAVEKFDAREVDDLPAEVWEAYKALAGMVESAWVLPRVHRGWCQNCGEMVKRYSAKVSLTWHGRQFSREYALAWDAADSGTADRGTVEPQTVEP
jgi:hypothetical protein